MKATLSHTHDLLDKINLLVQESIVVCDHDKNIIKANEAFTSISGYKENEVIGNRLDTLFSSNHDIWPEVQLRGVWQGEIRSKCKNGDVYIHQQTISTVHDQDGKIVYYIAISIDMIDKIKAENKIHRLEHYDQATCLPNKILLKQLLSREITESQNKNKQFAVLFLNLNKIKQINCSMGHQTGDDLLNIVAQRLCDCTHNKDIVAKWSSDEFVIILPDIKQADDVIAKLQNIYPCLVEPITFPKEKQYVINTSIGISLFPCDGNSAKTLIQNAAMAMNIADKCKCEGNNYQFYSAEMNIAVIEHMSIETGLRSALELEQFELHYQPVIDIKSQTITGAEALIRWNHAKKGLILPDRFIPVAEESDLIIRIGEWVLNEACMQNKKWQQNGHDNLKININLSARQFCDTHLPKTVRDALDRSNIDPSLLTLELTESVIMDNVDKTIKNLHALKDIGVNLAIDDFGTGYSSLAYLKRFPIDTLKIDKSFIRDVDVYSDDKSIVQSIIALGHSLNLNIVAEGIERIEHLNLLNSENCEEAQGYYISKPLKADDFDEFVHQYRNKMHIDSNYRSQNLKVV